MSPSVLLLVLRILSALLLLAFLAVLLWLLYQDIVATTNAYAAIQRPQGTLVVAESESGSIAVGTQYSLLPSTSIGRAAGNTLVIDDDYLSGQHALIALRDRQWWIEDLGSRNGTLLNDYPVEKATVVAAGDIITVGNTSLRVEL